VCSEERRRTEFGKGGGGAKGRAPLRLETKPKRVLRKHQGLREKCFRRLRATLIHPKKKKRRSSEVTP